MKNLFLYCLPLIGLLTACPRPPCESVFDCAVGESCVEGECLVAAEPDPEPVVEPEDDAGIRDAGLTPDAGGDGGPLVDGGDGGFVVDGGDGGFVVDGGDGGLPVDGGLFVCVGATWDDDGNPATACVSHSTCVAGQFISAAGTESSDRICANCSGDNFTATENAAGCAAKTNCVPGEQVAAEGGTTADRTCAACEDSFSTTTNATACTPWTLCRLGDQAPGSSVSDVLCVAEPVQLSAGGLTTCAVLDDGAVKCWGANDVGQLGNGMTLDSNTPVSVTGLPASASRVTVGGNFACALLVNGTVMCWGGNESGQLGNDTFVSSDVPVTASGLAGVLSIGAGSQHMCAATGEETACWGENATFQLGRGSGDDNPVPVVIPTLSGAGAVSIAGGLAHTCATFDDFSAMGWGRNIQGQAGANPNPTPIVPAPSSVVSDSGLSQLTSGDDHVCAISTTFDGYCWGSNVFGQIGGELPLSRTARIVPGLTAGTLSSIVAGGRHTCAVFNDNTAKCWGDNARGQIGDGTTDETSTPVSVPGLTNVVSMAAGAEHTCALLGNATISCWGSNNRGALGDGSLVTENLNPTTVAWP